MHEKNGAITDETPDEIRPPAKPGERDDKTARDAKGDHAATRAADAVADAARRQRE